MGGLEAQHAARRLALELQAARRPQGEAGGDPVGALFLDQFVDEAAHLARVTAGLAGAFLAIVQFLDHLHGQEHIVFLELEQRRRVVHQHIGVEDVEALA